MNKLIGFLILGFVWLFFVWLAFSFGLWDLNPANWDGAVRVTCAFIGFFPPLFIVPQMWHD
jgi:hypothetical protein